MSGADTPWETKEKQIPRWRMKKRANTLRHTERTDKVISIYNTHLYNLFLHCIWSILHFLIALFFFSSLVQSLFIFALNINELFCLLHFLLPKCLMYVCRLMVVAADFMPCCIVYKYTFAWSFCVLWTFFKLVFRAALRYSNRPEFESFELPRSWSLMPVVCVCVLVYC